MKVLVFASFALALFSLPASTYAFENCKKGECVYEECSEKEILDRVESAPIVKCMKVTKLNPKTKERDLVFYEIGVKLILPGKSDGEACRNCASINPGILFRVR